MFKTKNNTTFIFSAVSFSAYLAVLTCYLMSYYHGQDPWMSTEPPSGGRKVSQPMSALTVPSFMPLPGLQAGYPYWAGDRSRQLRTCAWRKADEDVARDGTSQEPRLPTPTVHSTVPQISLTKHKFREKILKNVKSVAPECYTPSPAPSERRALCPSISHIPMKLALQRHSVVYSWSRSCFSAEQRREPGL